jgi:hypothetical protein
MRLFSYTAVALAMLLLTTFVMNPRDAFTQEPSTCDHCKAKAQCTKVCHWVCEEKKVEVTCWGCECEEFCIPGPSTPNCQHCKELKCYCVEGINPKVSSKPKAFSWTSWLPGGASIYTKKKLMKRTTMEKIPTHLWVVEELCPECKQQIAIGKNEQRPLGK